MDISPRQQKRLEKLSKTSTQLEASIAIVSSLDDLENELEDFEHETSTKIEGVMSELEVIKQGIADIVIPVPKDYADTLAELKSKVEEEQEVVVTLNII